MIVAHLNTAANAARSHALLCKSFIGLLALALEAKDPIGAGSRNTMFWNAGAAGAHFVAQFDNDVRAAVDAIIASALRDSGAYKNPAMTDEYLAELNDYGDSVLSDLSAKMQAVVNGNIATLMTELRQIRLAASMLQVSRGMTYFGAMMKTRMGRLEDLQFTTQDAGGRRWRSGDYVRSMVSKALLQLYVEAFVYCAAVQGDKQAQVVYPDPSHEGNGRIFTIVGYGPDCFETIKDAIWHPNSTAGVQRVHS